MVRLSLSLCAGARLGVVDDAGDIGLQARAFADDAHAHAFARQPVQIARHIEPQQIEQRAHFLGGPAPVLGREAEHRQIAHAQFAGGLDRAAQRFDALRYDRTCAAVRAACAQRPLPSMMMATCAGGAGRAGCGLGRSRQSALGSRHSCADPTANRACLNLHDLLFLVAEARRRSS